MSGLTKTRVVLNLTFWRRGGYVCFGEVDTSVTRIDLSDEAYSDMGCPSQITVTVERGDMLNEESV
jgi:hypothetical protein